MNVTETKRRLRVATNLVRDQRHYPTNWRVEIGLRGIPVHVTEREATYDDVWINEGKGDDLDGFVQVDELRAGDADREWTSQIFEDGYIVHLYFSSTGDWGELADIVTVWLGDRNHEPAIVDRGSWA